jgi:hypothetical protein
MKDEAIALRRISSYKQSEGHSLEAQQLSTEKMAEQLGVRIIRSWDLIQTSNKGKNFGRKDMEEMFRFCKQTPNVKYLLIDFVNRLMREVEIMIYYKVRFNQIGVQLQFCDPAQHQLNTGDQYAQLMLYLEGYKAEQDNDARRQTSISRMKTRYEAGYYLSHPHAGFMKSGVAGLHIPDPERFELLRKGSRLIIYDQRTPEQAVHWMNDNGYRTVGGKRLDVGHYAEFIVDTYYYGKIYVKSDGWPKDVDGLHTPMFSKREHDLLVAAITKRNPHIRQKHNPEFPMSNTLRHTECEGAGGYEKFTGHFRNPGKRPSGRQRAKEPVYDCRDCRKRLARKKTHQAFSSYLNSLEFLPSQEKFRRALVKVWKSQRGSMQQRLNALNANRGHLEQDMRKTAANYGREPEGAAKNALRLLLEDYDKRLKQLDLELISARNTEMESEDFVKFAFDFAASMRDRWLSLSPENMKRGEQVLFNGKIYMDNSANVHPSKLSSIYRLGTNKKALENASNAFVEELAGTAPASDGLFG